jgi:SAM-dependent methyltransferase
MPVLSHWIRDSARMQALDQFEQHLARQKLRSEPAGSGIWLRPWSGAEPAAMASPSALFSWTLDDADRLSGCCRSASQLWPIADGALGFAVIQHALEFAHEAEDILAEAARSLRGHGRLLIFGVRSVSAARFSRHWRLRPAKLTSASSWALACRALGLADITVERFGAGWPWKNIAADSWLDQALPSLSSVFLLSARKRAGGRIAAVRPWTLKSRSAEYAQAQARQTWIDEK